MAPQSLYRKYRPQRFAEMVGQEHVLTALKNAVREGRVGHAYLFSGPRGTGKTTTARLLAKALNCLDLTDDGEPCGKCENCVAIAAGTFYDLVELDAASRRGVESARELVQNVNVGMGPSARSKVYVIDEVHMLTTDASNTLLKTLEEPPEHVVFVLATTEPGKVLPTIRSRTQHFEFQLLSHEQLVWHLGHLLEQEGIDADPDALDLIARRAAGSDRDALSALDQALALGGGKLDRAKVEASFGETAFGQRVAILEAIAAEDPAGALVAVQSSLHAGADPRRIAEDLLRTLRDAFVLANANGRVPYDGPAEEADRLRALASSIGNAALVRAIETLGDAIVDIRGPATPDPRLVLEVAVVRLARRDARASIDALIDRIERLEKALAGGAPIAAAAPIAPATPAPAVPTAPALTAPAPAAADSPSPASASAPAPATAPAAEKPARRSGGAHLSTRSTPAAQPAAAPVANSAPAAPALEEQPGVAVDVDVDRAIEAWALVLDSLKAPLRATIQDAHPIGVEHGAIVFGVTRVRFDAINQRFRAEAAAIKQAFAQQLGVTPKFVLRPHDFDAPGALKPVAETATATATATPAAAPKPAAPARRERPVVEEEPPPIDDLVDEGYDPDDLVDATDAPVDSIARLQSEFGAQIVEERGRDA